MNISELINGINSGAFDDRFRTLYGSSEVLSQHIRYLSAAERFSRLYPEHSDIQVFSASGRTEIGGNHTDHQNGCVLAAAVSMDMIAFVGTNDSGIIRFSSEQCPECTVDLSDLSVHEDEKGTTAALIRGVAAGFAGEGVTVSGLDILVSSDIPSGSGLSSSAAFEVLIGTVIDCTFNNSSAGPVDIAKTGQYAENVYFGKASGLMDQMVSALGGSVFLDFEDPDDPSAERIDFSFEDSGYCICITETGSSHADLTKEYSAVSAEMKHVAKEMGHSVLRETDEEEFYRLIPELRKVCTDREILRAAHFYAENERAALEAQALRNSDTEEFFELVNASGDSSAQLLQNLYTTSAPQEQSIPVALMLSKRILGGSGAVRVHGGGFAGTIQAFIPLYTIKDYIITMENVFGKGSCHVLNIRPEGGIRLIE